MGKGKGREWGGGGRVERRKEENVGKDGQAKQY